MKNKLHTIYHTEPSLRVTKCIEKSKFPNFQIFLFSILYTLFSTPATAQQYNWDWAISGGGMQGADLIYDVKVGSDNNYYFIGSMHGHAVCSINGVFQSFDLSPASVHDIHYLQDIKMQLSDCVILADKGYLSSTIQLDLFKEVNIQLETPKRKNQKRLQTTVLSL